LKKNIVFLEEGKKGIAIMATHRHSRGRADGGMNAIVFNLDRARRGKTGEKPINIDLGKKKRL